MPLEPRKRIYRFGPYEADVEEGTLTKGGTRIRLQDQPFQILTLLLDRPGQLVTREEIRQELWPGNTFVEFDDGLNVAVRKLRAALCDSADNPRFLETVPRRGYRFVAPLSTSTPAPAPQAIAAAEDRVMLAVLPFQNLSADPEQEYFVDGLTEETIAHLGSVSPERIGVIARTTSMAYKNTRKSILEIGSELNVDYVLESSVRREANRVRIIAQLIRVKDQTPLWAATYDREMSGILSLQSELGTAIAQHVHLKLSPTQVTVLAHRQTLNIEAYDLYLRGRYFWNQLSAPATRKAMELYDRAIQLDPGYALAWSGIVDANSSSPVNGDAPPLHVWPEAKAALDHAVRSGPSLPEVQASLGFVNFWLDWDWIAAESALRKSISLDPSFPLAHRLLGIVLAHLGRHEEAEPEVRLARERDPLNPTNYALSAQVAFAARDFAGAVQFAQQAIATNAEFWIGHFQLGQAYEQMGSAHLALEALSTAGRLSGENSKTIALRGYIFARLGKAEKANEVLDSLRTLSRERFVPPYATALVYAGLDQRDLALQWLEHAYVAHDVHWVFPPIDPKWDPYRQHPHFQELLRRCSFTRPKNSPPAWDMVSRGGF